MNAKRTRKTIKFPCNQRELRRLVLSVQASLHRLNLLIAIGDDPDYRDDISSIYEAELTAYDIACHQITLNPLQPSLKQSRLDWQAPTTPSAPLWVTVLGADALSGERLEQPKLPQDAFAFPSNGQEKRYASSNSQ